MNIRLMSAALAAWALLASCVLSFDTTLPVESASDEDTGLVGDADSGVDSGDLADAAPDGNADDADAATDGNAGDTDAEGGDTADAMSDVDVVIDADVVNDTNVMSDADSESDAGMVQTLGAECTADSDCPTNTWCSTVSGYRRCSPRVFNGEAHQMDFVFVPSGTFEQGRQGATDWERPYTATISRNYFVSRTEVTQGQWKAATGVTNPSYYQNTTCINGTCSSTENANNTGPVEQVDWYSALAYANWLSLNQGLSACYTLTPSTCADAVSDWATGDTVCTGATFVGLTCTGYRLLTESEWERAARGNTTSTYYWGEATDTATVGLYAWFDGNAGNRTQAVGGKQANAFGLFDMSGNVWEWVWDWVYSGSAWVSYPSGSATDYIGPSSGSLRGVRGGSWLYDASFLRSANRLNYAPSYRNDNVGFRLARTAN